MGLFEGRDKISYLEGVIMKLRRFEPQDAETLYLVINNEMDTYSRELTVPPTLDECKTPTALLAADVVFTAVDCGNVVGFASIHKFNARSRTCWIGAVVLEKQKGIGRCVGEELVRHCFDCLSVRQIRARCLVDAAFVPALKSFGFVQEGVYKDSCVVNGQLKSEVILCLSKEV